MQFLKMRAAPLEKSKQKKHAGLEAFGRKLLVADNIAEDIDKKLKLPTINTEEYVLELSEAEKAIIKTLGKGNNGTRSL